MAEVKKEENDGLVELTPEEYEKMRKASNSRTVSPAGTYQYIPPRNTTVISGPAYSGPVNTGRPNLTVSSNKASNPSTVPNIPSPVTSSPHISSTKIEVKETTVGPQTTKTTSSKDGEILLRITNEEVRPDAITKAPLTAEEQTEADKKLRRYNVEGNEYQSPSEKPEGRKAEGGEDGLIYNIETVIESPSKIKLEGYILYEKPVDVIKYVQSVNYLSNYVDKSVKEVQMKTSEYLQNSTTVEQNTRFDEEALAERNKFNQAIESAVVVGSNTNALIDTVKEDEKKFKTFNHNLKLLKRAIKLKLLHEAANRVNNNNTCIKTEVKTMLFTSPSPANNTEKQADDITLEKYEVHDFYSPDPNTVGLYTSDFRKQEHMKTVTTRRYRHIDLRNISDGSDWSKCDKFYDDVILLEDRLRQAGQLSTVEYYNNPNVVDMDDPKSPWFNED